MSCLTLSLLPEILSLTPSPLPPPPPGVGKAERDVYALPNVATSPHFAVRWGDGGSVNAADVDRLLASFEESWSVEIDELGMPAPYGSDEWLFNVYIGDTGGPSAGGVYGYYSVDSQSWPMVVISQEALAASSQGLGTVPHEFFHALQAAAGTYDYSGEAAWWWEATATWMESVVYPSDPNYAVFLFGFAFLPHYSLSFFDYYDTGAFQEYYQYGAFIFPRYISEYVAGPEVIVDTWLDPRGYTEPLAPLAEALAEEGVELEEEIARFSAHNAVWDYTDSGTYTWYLDYYATLPEFSSFDARITAEVPAGGTDGLTPPPAATLPERYGYNVLSMPEPGAEQLWLTFSGDAAGSGSTPARWAVTVVRQDGGVAYETVTLADGEGVHSIEDIGPDEALSVVVVPLADERIEGETFSYRYALGAQVAEAADTGDTGGIDEERCGCRGGSALILLPLYSSILFWRRKTMMPLPSSKISS